MSSIKILKDKCIGCKKCITACPFNAIEVTEKKAVILDNCTLCGSCVESCKFGAIELIKDEVEYDDLSKYNGIWVYCEQYGQKLRPVALELVGQARLLADKLSTTVTAVVIGDRIAEHGQALIAGGADEVLIVNDRTLGELNDLIYTDIMVELVKKHRPSIILLGATSFGRSFAPRVAARLHTGLTADCTILEADPEKGLLLQTRPAFGGNLMATIICPNHRPQMATVRPKVFSPLEPDYRRLGKITEENISLPQNSLVEIIEHIKGAGETVNIGAADIIIAAGKGIGNAKNMALVEELAALLGGAVGVSRPLVDSAWKPYAHQVGQTGKTVAPKLYIACGISGAIQHVAGIAAETVVAINNDPDAPIFQYAHYAVVGDCVEVLESLIEKIKKTQAQAV